MRTDATPENRDPCDSAADQSARGWTPVADVQGLSGYRLRVRFNDGVEGEVDMSRLIHGPHAGVFAALRDEALFRKVHLAFGAVTGRAASTLPQTQCTGRFVSGAGGW